MNCPSISVTSNKINTLSKIIFTVVCIIFFCVPTTVMAVNDARNEQINIDTKDLLIDKQLAYAGISSYDSRKYFNTYVFNQESTMTCWANSGLMALTISIDSQGGGRYIFSRRHAALSINDSMQDGGMFDWLAAYITGGNGPVLEIEMPWKNIESSEDAANVFTKEEEEIKDTLQPTKKVNSWERFPAIFKKYDENGNIVSYNRIKKTAKEMQKSKDEIDEMVKKASEAHSKFINAQKAYAEAEEKYEKVSKEFDDFAANAEDMSNEEYEREEQILMERMIEADNERKKYEEECKNRWKDYSTLINEAEKMEYNEIVLTDEQLSKQRDEIKRAILRYGAVDVVMTEGHMLGNIATGFISTNELLTNGHAIIAIGWDDNYPVENFTGPIKPRKPGAYLIQNSWGKSAYNPEGTFWISYEDFWVEKSISVFKEVVDVDYNNIYQYNDIAGVGGMLREYKANQFYEANVFTRDDTEVKETIYEISIQNVNKTKCEVYLNPQSGELDETKLIKVATTDIIPAGYNTIKFDKEVELTGEQFAVVVKHLRLEGQKEIDIAISTVGELGGEYKFGSTKFADGMYEQSYVGTSLTNMTDLYDYSEIISKYEYDGSLSEACACIKAFTKVSELAENEIEEEPNPSTITSKKNTKRIKGGLLTGAITREDLNKSENFSTFSVQKGGEMPARGQAGGLGFGIAEHVLGGTNLTTTVSTGGKSQIVENPQEGQKLFQIYQEDGASVKNVYPTTTSVSLSNYTAGNAVQVGENDQYQASYIFTHMEENKTYNSEVQQALWSTDLNKGDKVLPNALGEEANAYATFRNTVNNSGGYEKSITNQTVGQTVTYNRKTKKYTIGPFKVTYIRAFANVEGREKIDFGAMTEIKMYDQNNKEINKETWKIIWNEKDKKARQQGDSDYVYPYSEEEFYIEMNYEGNEDVTSISKFEYYYKELKTTAEYVPLTGGYGEFSWTQKVRGYTCMEGTTLKPCKHGSAFAHIYAHDYWITASKIREIESEKLISVTWADTIWTHYVQTVEFGEKKNLQETNNGNKYQIGLTLELTGYVWEDGIGYEDSGDGNKETNEKGIKGVKVTLYKIENDNKTIAQIFDATGNKKEAITYTTAAGKYHIEGIPVGEYDIEFTYDGQNYTTTKLLEIVNKEKNLGAGETENLTDDIVLTNPTTVPEKIEQYKQYSNEDEYAKNSKAKENPEERERFNSKFYEITEGKAIGKNGGTIALEYINGKLVTTDKDGHVKDEFAMKVTTTENNITFPLKDEFTISQKNKIINDIEYNKAYKNMYYVNMGLIKRAEADFELTGDLTEAKVTINRKEMTYTYGTASAEYIRELYKADMNFRIQDYKSNTLNNNAITIQKFKSEDNELKVYVTYKITIKNTASQTSGIINELLNYYDENYTIVSTDKYLEIEDDKGNPQNKLVAKQSYYEVGGYTGKINWQESSKNSNHKQAGFKTAYTTDLNNIILREHGEIDVYITYEVNKNATRAIITGEKKNAVEINSYSILKNGASQKDENIGRIDKDSAPGDSTPYDIQTQEDDATYLGKLNVKPYDTNRRTINGMVWEDNRTNRLNNEQYVGNGLKDIWENPINGVKVQLIEVIKQNGIQYEYIWQEMSTGENGYKYIVSAGNSLDNQSGTAKAGTIENERGCYKFTDYVAGNYIVRYIYGDSGKTVLTGKNTKSYNGQDYKSTAYHQGNGVDEEWYNLSDRFINNTAMSDAKDNAGRRLQVINYSETMNNKIAQVLVSHEQENEKNFNSSKHKELIENTYMYADTAKINVKVEYDQTSGSGRDTYTYNIRDIDFGLEQRPETNITISNEIVGVKLTLSDGSVIINTAEGSRHNVLMTPTLGEILGKIHIYMDEEIMQGAEIEIVHKITVKNDSEVDSYGSGFNVGTTYYTGKNSNDKTVTTTVEKLIDYVDNSLVFKEEKNPGWKLISNTSLESTNKMKETGMLDKNTQTTQKISVAKKETTQVLINESLSNKGLKPGEKAEVYLTLNKVLSAHDETDELSYNNMAEIIEISNDVGRRNGSKVVGNQHVEGMPIESDADNSDTVIITPPYGENKNNSGIIFISVGILVIIGSVILGIKQKGRNVY